METACLQCGSRGFTNAFVYCVKCLDVAVHRYCLDVIPDNFYEFIHWVCDECKDEAENKKSKDDGHTSAEPVSKPIWTGSFHIWNEKPRLLDGVIAHMSSRACQEVYEESSQFQPVLQLEMLPKSAVWPKRFEISEPSSDSIALYFFPSEISELAFDLFVDEMMHKDLAMRASVQNAELLVFTSKELPSLYWRYQDKYYLWGVFTGKHRLPSHSQSHREELGKHMMIHADLFNDTGVDGCKIIEGVKSCARTPVDTQRKAFVEDATQEDKKRSHIHDGGKQTKPLNDSRPKAECQYCGFVSSHGGISHLRPHLGGGDLRIHVPGCCKVPEEVKRIIAESVSGCVQNRKVQSLKNIQATTGNSRKRGRPLDDAWDHAIPVDDIRQGAKCKYCNFVSKRGGITRLKAHLSGGDPTMRIRGCPNVSPDIKILMESEMKTFMERPEIPFQGTAKSCGRGRPLDGAWEHCIPLDNIRQGAKCKYCNFVSKRGGITRLKAHLSGGDPTMRIRGCSNVSPDIKFLMEREMKTFMERPEIPFQGTAKSSGRGRPLDGAWEHCIPLDNIRQGAKCTYCNFVSKSGGITRLKAHLSGGDPAMRIRGCPNVSPDIKILMEREMKTFMERPKIPFQGTAKSCGRGRPLDGAWEHCIPLDNIRQGAKCEYCKFVSKRDGITRLKAHLSGGDPTMRISGCPNVSPDIKILMERERKKFMDRPKIPFRGTAKSSGRGRPLDGAWEHCIPLDSIRQGAKCEYCNFVSKRGGITRLKAHLSGGAPTMRISGCPNVSPDIKILMEREMKKFMERSKIPFQGTAKSSGRGRPLDGAWEHCMPLDNIRQGAKCEYCNFVSKRGGITRLKAHLSGGAPTMRIRGCPNVSPDIKILMESEMKKFMERSKIPFQGTVKSSGRGRPLDGAWEHCIPLDNIRQGAKCKYCNFVSKRGGIARLKAHLGGGDPIMRIRGCLNASAEVKSLMAEGIKKCIKMSNGKSVGGTYKDLKIIQPKDEEFSPSGTLL